MQFWKLDIQGGFTTYVPVGAVAFSTDGELVTAFEVGYEEASVYMVEAMELVDASAVPMKLKLPKTRE